MVDAGGRRDRSRLTPGRDSRRGRRGTRPDGLSIEGRSSASADSPGKRASSLSRTHSQIRDRPASQAVHERDDAVKESTAGRFLKKVVPGAADAVRIQAGAPPLPAAGPGPCPRSALETREAGARRRGRRCSRAARARARAKGRSPLLGPGSSCSRRCGRRPRPAHPSPRSDCRRAPGRLKGERGRSRPWIGLSGPTLSAEEVRPRGAASERRDPSAGLEPQSAVAAVEEIRSLPGAGPLFSRPGGRAYDRLRDLVGRFPAFHARTRAGLARRAGEPPGACALLARR